MNNMEIKKENIRKGILYFILLFSFFQSDFLLITFPRIDLIYRCLKIFSFLIIIILTLMSKKISKIICIIFIYLLFLFCSTIINQSDINQCLVIMLNVFTLCLIIDYGLKNNPGVFLKIFEFYLSILVYINFFTIILFPNGLYCDNGGSYLNWFLGYKNSHILFLLPTILVSFINSYYKSNRLSLKNCLLVILSILTLLLNKSSTGLIGIFIIIILLFLVKVFKSKKIFNIRNYFLGYIILFFSIVVLRIQNLFSFFIIDVLHKDITFTGRTFIWDYIFKFIKNKPLLGYGIENKIVRLNKTFYWKSYHAHDQLLEVMYKTGIIGLIVYLYMIYISMKELHKYRDSKIASIMSIVMFAYFIMMLTEAYSFEYIIFILVFCYNIKYLVDASKKQVIK